MYPEDGKWDHKSSGRFEELTHGNCIKILNVGHLNGFDLSVFIYLFSQLHNGKN